MAWRLRKDTPGPLKTVMERLKRISLIPILRQVLYLGVSSAGLLPSLWLCCHSLSLVNQLWIQILLTEFLKVLAMVLGGPMRKQVAIFRVRVCSKISSLQEMHINKLKECLNHAVEISDTHCQREKTH